MKPSPRARHCSNHISGDVENLPEVTHQHCDVSCCFRPKDLAHPLSCDCLKAPSLPEPARQGPGWSPGARRPGQWEWGAELLSPPPARPSAPSPPFSTLSYVPAEPSEGRGAPGGRRPSRGGDGGGRKKGRLSDGGGSDVTSCCSRGNEDTPHGPPTEGGRGRSEPLWGATPFSVINGAGASRGVEITSKRFKWPKDRSQNRQNPSQQLIPNYSI